MGPVLVDTSVWVSHFRHRNNALIALLQADLVLTHPMIVAELACGTPPEPRLRTLGDLDLMEKVQQATHRVQGFDRTRTSLWACTLLPSDRLLRDAARKAFAVVEQAALEVIEAAVSAPARLPAMRARPFWSG